MERRRPLSDGPSDHQSEVVEKHDFVDETDFFLKDPEDLRPLLRSVRARETSKPWRRRSRYDVPPVLDMYLAEQGDLVALMREALLNERTFTIAVAAEVHTRARRLGGLATVLSLGATVLAALAAISVLGDALGRWFTGITAGSAALISGIQTAFRPSVRARGLTEVAIQWTEQVAEIEDLLFFRLSELAGDRTRMRSEYKVILGRRFRLLRLMRLGQEHTPELTSVTRGDPNGTA